MHRLSMTLAFYLTEAFHLDCVQFLSLESHLLVFARGRKMQFDSTALMFYLSEAFQFDCARFLCPLHRWENRLDG